MQDYRLNRLREAGRSHGFDCLVASSAQNIAYMTGGYRSIGQSVSASTQIYAVQSFATGKISYVISVADVPNILEFAGTDAIIYAYGPFHFEFEPDQTPFTLAAMRICEQRYKTAEEALCAAVHDAGIHPGFDETHINFALAERIAGLLSLPALPAASAAFREARRIKHPDEIRMLQESARIAEAALLEALDGIKPGITEAELQLRYQQAVIRRGANPYFFVATTAHRAAFVDAHNTVLPIQEGDMIRFDFGCIKDGIYSDLARTAVMGHATPEVETAYRAVEAGAQAAFAKLRPGAIASEIFEAAVAATRAAGLPDYARSHCGHGIGLEGYDVPSIAPGVSDTIEKNMVLCIETPYYRIGWGGVQVENTVAVTETGFTFLDSGNTALIVIPV